MPEDLINARTEYLLQSFISRPSSSLIIAGEYGSGLDKLCDDLTKKVLAHENTHNILLIGVEDEKSIGVDKIRELKRSLLTAVGSSDKIARVAIIKEADKLTHEAQNSLLKLIEEPSKNTLIILVVSRLGMLIDTVKSRCQIIKVLPLTKEQAKKYAQSVGVGSSEAEKAYLLSGGQAQLFADIISGENTILNESIAMAKSFVAAKPFQRLIQQKDFSDAAALHNLIDGLILIAEAGLHGPNKATRQRWKDMLGVSRQSLRLLDMSTAPKLVFLHLCTHL